MRAKEIPDLRVDADGCVWLRWEGVQGVQTRDCLAIARAVVNLDMLRNPELLYISTYAWGQMTRLLPEKDVANAVDVFSPKDGE